MKYALLIYTDEKAAATITPEEMQSLMGAYRAFTDDVKEKKMLVAGEPLHPVASATSVRVREGKTVTTDGPFAETKEQLGGFYILDCRDLNEAIEYAAKIPGAKAGTIEVRPVWMM